MFTKTCISDNSVSISPIRIKIANGIVKHDTVVNCDIQTLGQTSGNAAQVLVGGDTPDLLCIGKRCMEQGYGFHWNPGELPYITLPNNDKLVLHVEHYVPYLYDNNSHKTSAVPASPIDTVPQHMPVLPAVESDTEAEDEPGTPPPRCT